MMNGIEILSQVDKTKVAEWVNWWMGISLFLILIFFVLIIIIAKVSCTSDTLLIFLFVCLSLSCMSIIFSGIVSGTNKYQVYDHTEYKVTISENINFIEFDNKYEIVEQDGKIYTIKEKDIDK